MAATPGAVAELLHQVLWQFWLPSQRTAVVSTQLWESKLSEAAKASPVYYNNDRRILHHDVQCF